MVKKIPVIIPLFLLVFLLAPSGAMGLDSVVLDPGHGGYESGIRAGGLREKDIALSIARHLKGYLRERGKEVLLTREVDRYVSMAERRKLISSRAPDALLSIHLADSEQAAIYVMWYREMEPELSLKEYYQADSRQRKYLYESRVLAGHIGEALGAEFGIGVRYGELPLPLLSAAGAPAVLVELPSRGAPYDEETVRRCANALGAGLEAYERK